LRRDFACQILAAGTLEQIVGRVGLLTSRLDKRLQTEESCAMILGLKKGGIRLDPCGELLLEAVSGNDENGDPEDRG
jgi:hypothetical protein